MVDRRSSINYINDKYLGKRGTSYVQPSVITTPVAPIVETYAQPQQQVYQEVHHAPIETRHTSSGSGRICGCPWWLCLLLTLLGLLLLGVLIGFLTGLFGNKSETTTTETTTKDQGNTDTNAEGSEEKVNGGTVEAGCNQGFFAHNGKCISCPEGSSWNGENCIKSSQSHLISE